MHQLVGEFRFFCLRKLGIPPEFPRIEAKKRREISPTRHGDGQRRMGSTWMKKQCLSNQNVEEYFWCETCARSKWPCPPNSFALKPPLHVPNTKVGRSKLPGLVFVVAICSEWTCHFLCFGTLILKWWNIQTFHWPPSFWSYDSSPELDQGQ